MTAHQLLERLNETDETVALEAKAGSRAVWWATSVDLKLLNRKGKGRASYYVPGSNWIADYATGSGTLKEEAYGLNTEAQALKKEARAVNTEPRAVNTEPRAVNTEPQGVVITPEAFLESLSVGVQQRIIQLKRRTTDRAVVSRLIVSICNERACSLSTLSSLLKRKENTLSRNYLRPLLLSGKLQYTIPEIIHHPRQAYRTPATPTDETPA